MREDGTDDKKMQVGTVRATPTGRVNRTRKQMRCGVGGTEAAKPVGWLKMGSIFILIQEITGRAV